jgi:hypothetical protein
MVSWGAPSIEGHSAFIQACDWLYIEAALTFFFSFFSILFFFFLFLFLFFYSDKKPLNREKILKGLSNENV